MKIALAYKVVYDAIIAEMDKGIIPWKKPWKSGFPRNAVTDRDYRGINVLLLFGLFDDARWLTFNQTAKLGGTVVKGEKSSKIVFWTRAEDKKNSTPGNKKYFPLLRYYNVFNVSQISGIEFDKNGRDSTAKNLTAESVIAGYKGCPKITQGKPIACYIPNADAIQIPNQDKFDSDERYYATLFHELIHSTGHGTRCNREGVTDPTRFGDSKYSFEELVAELGSAFLCAKCGIDNTVKSSASYIEGWKSYLTYNPQCLIQAASKAQQAVDYILGTEFDNDPDEEDTVEDTAEEAKELVVA
jgi:antirestriction protein ArdC